MLAVSGKIPLKYVAQVQTQLAITQADLLYYFSYHPKLEPQGAIVEVKPDHELIQKLIEAAKKFWLENVEKDVPPPESENEMIVVTDPTSVNLVRDWQAVKGLLDKAKVREEELRAQLIERFKFHPNVECDNVLYSRTNRKGAIDYSKVPELKGVDLEQYRKPESEYHTVKLKESDEKKVS